MFGAATLGLVLLAPASPVPQVPPAAKSGEVDRSQVVSFAHLVHGLAARVQDEYARKIEMSDLLCGAVRGLYDEAGLPLPDEVLEGVKKARGHTEQLNALIDVRTRLGNHPALSGPRSLFAAVGGFRHATDPGCTLITQRVQNIASFENDFGIGIELDGATGPRWAMYQTEFGTAIRWFPATGWFGPVPRPDAVPPPVTIPWRVKRVIPGSPAQKAGMKPGDAITHYNGIAITYENAPKLFAEFAFPSGGPNFGAPNPVGLKRSFTFLRTGSKSPFTMEVEAKSYVPECVFGVVRRADGTWDGMLDREHKIGYVRLGPVEDKAEDRVEEIFKDLTSRGCRGVILDLRWCPIGYITSMQKVLGLFLPPGTLVARMEFRNESRRGQNGSELRTLDVPRFPTIPLVILVGSETSGGGELIAAALQDHKRGVVMGQRTVGRAYVQNSNTDAGFGNLMFKISTGVTFRPSGKPRQRTETSQPTDDWGVRPDEGFEVPVTTDLSSELRHAAELQSLRPAESDEALAFDDPAKDPFRLTALTYLRKKFPAR